MTRTHRRSQPGFTMSEARKRERLETLLAISVTVFRVLINVHVRGGVRRHRLRHLRHRDLELVSSHSVAAVRDVVNKSDCVARESRAIGLLIYNYKLRKWEWTARRLFETVACESTSRHCGGGHIAIISECSSGSAKGCLRPIARGLPFRATQDASTRGHGRAGLGNTHGLAPSQSDATRRQHD